ncbi:hypothetical protein HOY80DRAFT_991370 [Tuber brumale]|nr:hypothetical protein HOY80DRAFT_991370 [Tuber brumale]
MLRYFLLYTCNVVLVTALLAVDCRPGAQEHELDLDRRCWASNCFIRPRAQIGLLWIVCFSIPPSLGIRTASAHGPSL